MLFQKILKKVFPFSNLIFHSLRIKEHIVVSKKFSERIFFKNISCFESLLRNFQGRVMKL